MTITVFNRAISVPKSGHSKAEKFDFCGLDVKVLASMVKREDINSVLVTTVINRCLISKTEFTKEFLRDSSKSDLVILNSIFSTKISAEILKQIHP